MRSDPTISAVQNRIARNIYYLRTKLQSIKLYRVSIGKKSYFYLSKELLTIFIIRKKRAIYILYMHKGENGAVYSTTNSIQTFIDPSKISLIPCRGATSITIEGGEG